METSVIERYTDAVDALCCRLKKDRYVIAVILAGSMSYDVVWEKSDLDICIITSYEKQKFAYKNLVENGISIYAEVFSRNKFKKQLQQAVQGSLFHSFLMKGKILFTKDESIREYFEQARIPGKNDMLKSAMHFFTVAHFDFTKARKWYTVKKDYEYSFMYILYTVIHLSKVEVLLHKQVPTRESIHQALKLNPVFYNAVYTDLINQPKNKKTMKSAIEKVDQYMNSIGQVVYEPLLDYLAREQRICSFDEIHDHFQNSFCVIGLEWLADRGYVDLMELPLKITPVSTATVNQAAFLHNENY